MVDRSGINYHGVVFSVTGADIACFQPGGVWFNGVWSFGDWMT